MDRYKLHNTIINEMKEDNSLEIRGLSFKYLGEIFKKYNLMEYVEKYYCCHGEDFSCCIDEEFGWAVLAVENNKTISKCPTKTAQKNLYRRLVRELRDLNKYKNGCNYSKRKLFTSNVDGYIKVCIPLRDICSKDIWLVFEVK